MITNWMALAAKQKTAGKTVLRTFRLSSELDSALSKGAVKKKIGKNSLVASILNKYVEWDSIVEEFGYFTVPAEMVAMLLQRVGKEEVASIARQVAKRVASSLPLWYGKADLDGLLKYMSTSINYSGAHLQHRIETEGSVTRIIVYQTFDENGIAWVKAFNTGLVETVLGYPPKFLTHADSVETIIESKYG